MPRTPKSARRARTPSDRDTDMEGIEEIVDGDFMPKKMNTPRKTPRKTACKTPPKTSPKTPRKTPRKTPAKVSFIVRHS